MDDNDQFLGDAHAAAESGEWERVVTLLADFAPAYRDQTIAAALLRARAALHADVPARTIEALDDVAGLITRPDELLTATMLRGAAEVALGHADEGLALLEEAAATAVGDRRFEALLELARGSWRAQRLDPLAAVLDTISRANAVSAVPAAILAYAYELYGRLELRRSRRTIAARHFRDALDALALSPQPQPQLRVDLLQALLAIAIDTLDLRQLDRVHIEIREVDWESVALHARKQAALPLLALGEMLLGDLDAAWETGFALRATAAPGLQQIVADLTAAEVARAAGETWTPAQMLAKAAAAATQCAWRATGTAGARALLSLIARVATADPDTARALLAIYESLPSASSAQVADDSDIAPFEHLARAAIDGAEGKTRRQVAHLRRAIALWHDLDHVYGEMRACVTLAELTGDPRAVRRAAELTRLAPRSWLHQQAAACAERAQDVLKLSPAEHRVMLAIVAGLSSADIASRFGRSKNTIRNQTRRVFGVMGVRTRSALVVRCATLGLLDVRTHDNRRHVVIDGDLQRAIATT